MSKHTPEPWIVEKAHDIDAIAWVGQFAVLPQDHATQVVRGNTEEDARRIVACVNACKGFTTEGLERSQIGTIMYERLEAMREAIRQRDELLAALEMVIADEAPGYHDCIDDGEQECAWCVARSAIAKAKGGAS